MEIFKKEMPAKDSLQGELRISKVVMISIDMDLGPQKHRTEFSKGFSYR
jgi:hypothetical protein